ncbi:hypothetical protein [Pseudomonas sp. 22 E 5]|nr:hypothetical protein [Pseudomonas sp. 22 E 5]
MGVGALAYLAAPVVLVERGVPGGVGVAHQLSTGVALILLGAPIRQLAAEQAALSVIAELRAFTQGIGNDLQITALVVAETRRITRTIDMLDQLPECIPAQLFAFAGGVDNFHDLAVGVIAIAGDITQRIGLGDAVTARVVAILPAVVGSVGFHQRQCPMFQPQGRITAAQRVGFANYVTALIVAVLIAPTQRISRAEQLTFVIPLKQPGLAKVIAVLNDLMLSVPVPRTHALQTIGDPRESGLQVIVELVSIALIGPMPNHAPFQAFNQYPLIETAQSGGQLMLHHPAPGIVGKAPLHLAGCITHLREIARRVVAVAHQHFATLIRVQAFDVAHMALITNQLNLHQIKRIA